MALTEAQMKTLDAKYAPNTFKIQSNEPITTFRDIPETTQTSEKSVGGFLKNVATSGFDFAKNLATAVLHPIQTTKAVLGTAAGAAEKLVPGVQGQEKYADALVNMVKERYGSTDKAIETAYKDPVGVLSDLSIFLTGGGAAATKVGEISKVGKVAELGQTLSKAGSLIDPITGAAKVVTPVLKGAAKTVGATKDFAITQITGLNPETIKTIVQNPENFSAAEKAGLQRANLGKIVKTSLDSRLKSLSETGKEYEVIKNSPKTVTFETPIQTFLRDNFKISFKNGKVVPTAASGISSADVNALNEFLSVYGKKQTFTANEIINARQAVDAMKVFDKAKTKSTVIATKLRKFIDDTAKTQLPELAKADAKYAPEVSILKKLKKEFFDENGNLNDNAINKISNITGAGKDVQLARLKKLIPDIEQRVKLVKAIEDIAATKGQKVGTYARAALGGGGVMTGNVAMIVGAILSSPGVFVPLMVKYGKAAGFTTEVIKPVILKMKNAVKLTEKEKVIAKKILNTAGNLMAGSAGKDLQNLSK